MNDYVSSKKWPDNKKQEPPELFRGFIPLSLESADRILQNILAACGYQEAHLKYQKCSQQQEIPLPGAFLRKFTSCVFSFYDETIDIGQNRDRK